MVLLARTTPRGELKKRSEELSLFFVDIKEEDGVTPKQGVELRKIQKMGGRGVDANQVSWGRMKLMWRANFSSAWTLLPFSSLC